MPASQKLPIGLGIFVAVSTLSNAYITALMTNAAAPPLGLLLLACLVFQACVVVLLARFRGFKLLLVVVTALSCAWNVVAYGYFVRFAENIWYDKLVGNLAEGVSATAIYRWNAIEYFNYAVCLLPVVAALFVGRGTRWRGWGSWLGLVVGLVALEGVHVARGESLLATPARQLSANVLVANYGSLAYVALDKAFGLRTSRLVEPTALQAGPARPKTNNVVLVQVESLDSNTIGRKVGDVVVTPFLNSVVAAGHGTPRIVVNNFSGTINAEITVLNSIESKEMPSTYAYPNSLAKVFSTHGYQTLAFHGNSASYYHRDALYPRMGFDRFYDMASMGLRERVWGADDGDVFDFALATLGRQQGPVFSLVITMSSHNPYHLIDANLLVDGDFPDTLLGNYLASVHYVDAQLRRFCEALLARQPDTVILIYGDHPAFVKDDGYDSRSLVVDNEEISTVPLAVVGAVPAGYALAPVMHSQMDIGVTALALAGIAYQYPTFGLPVDRPVDRRVIAYNRGKLTF